MLFFRLPIRVSFITLRISKIWINFFRRMETWLVLHQPLLINLDLIFHFCVFLPRITRLSFHLVIYIQQGNIINFCEFIIFYVGNGLVLVVYKLEFRLKKSITYLIIFNLVKFYEIIIHANL